MMSHQKVHRGHFAHRYYLCLTNSIMKKEPSLSSLTKMQKMLNCLRLTGEFWFSKEWKKNYEMNEFAFWTTGMAIGIARGPRELTTTMHRNCWDSNQSKLILQLEIFFISQNMIKQFFIIITRLIKLDNLRYTSRFMHCTLWQNSFPAC